MFFQISFNDPAYSQIRTLILFYGILSIILCIVYYIGIANIRIIYKFLLRKIYKIPIANF